MLTSRRHLINNTLDNLWVQDGNRDTPLLSSFDFKYGDNYLRNVTCSSPRMILGLSGSSVIFQWRIASGTFDTVVPMNLPPQSFDMTGWKLAYQVDLVQETVTGTVRDRIIGRISQPGTYSISSIKIQTPPVDDAFWDNPNRDYTSYGTSNFANASLPTFNTFGSLWSRKMTEAGSNGLLLGGYVVKNTGTPAGKPAFVVSMSLHATEHDAKSPAPLRLCLVTHGFYFGPFEP